MPMKILFNKLHSRFSHLFPRGTSTRGAALIILVFFFISISLAIIQTATIGAIVELRTYRTIAGSKTAYVAADAGVEDIFYRTINNKTVPTSQTLTLNGATAVIGVTAVSASQSDVYVTGTASNNEVRKLYLSISKNRSVSFPYGAQVGEGGITMSNNTSIDGTGLANGDIYSNGQIVGGSNVTVTGNAISSSSLFSDQIASSTLCQSDETVGKTNPNIDYAQSFMVSTTTASIDLASVTLYIKRNGNAVGANIRITADDSGKPSTTHLATQALPYSIVATTYGWVTVSFASPATLNPGTLYWIVLDSTQSATKYWYWCRSNADNYATGTAAYKLDASAGGAWTAFVGDMAFKTTFGGGVSKIDSVRVSGTAKADTINNSNINGDAYYKTISGSVVTGTSYAGPPTPPYIPLPITDAMIAQWKTDAASGGTIAGSCGVGGVAACNTFPLSLGPKQINGNLIVAGGSTLTVTGTLYVTGYIDVNNNATIRCAFAYLGNSCMIIADGYISVSNNANFAGSEVAGSYIMLLSTKEDCLGTSGTGCGTNFSAISISNNVVGALFYASKSLIDISNNAIVTAVVGYMIQLQNNTGIMYDPLVSSISFAPASSGVTGAWNANRWNEF